MAQTLPSWRERVADEFTEQKGGWVKTRWVARFAAGVLTLGSWDFGIAALGNGHAKFTRAVRQANELTRARRR